MGLGRWCAVFVGIACLAPGSAWAADATVNLGTNNGDDRTIFPAFVTVEKGEKVTWTWGPAGDTNHTTTHPINGTASEEAWESDLGKQPNQVNHAVTDTFSHTFTQPGTYFYGCRVHETMRATVKVLGPIASFTAGTTTPFTGQMVQFDGSGSTDDPPGPITRYEWDLDGDATNGFETDTGATPTVSAPAPAVVGSWTVRLRVTDGDTPAKTDTGQRTLTVESRAPTARLTVSPNPANEGAVVTFNGTGSSDAGDDQIETWEWDLDGNTMNGFEVPPSSSSATTTSYPTFGARTVRLMVTDTAGNFHVASQVVTVMNQPPLASFMATPSSVLIDETVTFDASESSDPPPGTIAAYDWDLDGSAATGQAGFESPTGTTPTTSRSYPSAGTVNVRLRVTDEDGVSTITSRTVTVNAPAPPPSDPPPANPSPSSPPPADESPAPALPPPSVGGDSPPVLPPAVTATGPARQRALRQRGILVTGGCDRACSLNVRGTVNVPGASRVFRLRAVTRRLTAAGTTRVKLALPRAAQSAIRRALRSRKRVTATITVAATDASGTSTRTKRVQING